MGAFVFFTLFIMNNVQELEAPSELTTEPDTPSTIQQRLEIIEATVQRIEALLQDQRTIKEWYSVSEAADALDKAPFTIREWCRHGRVNAHKRPCGRGTSK